MDLFVILILLFIFFIIINKMRSKSKRKTKKSCNTLELARKYIAKTENDWNYILPSEFYEKYYPKLENGTNKDFILVDLRREEDFNKFHIKNATNIFWLNLLNESNLKKLPKRKKIFLICYVGHTSSQAMVLLKCLGYDVTSIKFGYGVSPSSNVKIAGWLDFNYPIVK